MCGGGPWAVGSGVWCGCGAHLAAQRRPRAVGEARVELVLRVEPLLRARARPRRRVLLDPSHDEADARRLALLAAKNRAAAVVVVVAASVVVAAVVVVVVVVVVVPARRSAHHAAEAEALLVVAVAEDLLRQQVLELGWPRVRRAARHLAKPLREKGGEGGMSTQREGHKHLKGGAEAPAARRQ